MPPKPKKPAPAGQPPAPPPVLDDIDLSAALPPAPPAPEPKRGRGRPRSAAPKPPRKYKVRKDKGVKRKTEPPQTPYIDNNILIGNNISRDGDIYRIDDMRDKGELSAASDLKAKMTLKELKFLGLFFSGEHGTLKSMKLAGFEAAHDSYLFLLAKKIIEKHETQAGDHRIIARAIGAGEVTILQGLLNLAKKGKSEMVRLNAWSQLAKILGLTKEQVEGAQGITIIFEAPNQPGQPAATLDPGKPEQAQPVTYTQPVRVLQITK